MKIGVKLVLVISIFNIIGIGLLAGITLTLSQWEISPMVNEHAVDLAVQSGERIGRRFEEYIVTGRALAHIMEGYKGIPVAERRDYFNMMMRQTLGANPELRSIYSHWAPNALDGMDEDYANTPGTDGTGRFKSAWNYVNGEFVVNPITGFEWNMVMQTPVFHEEFMLEPTVYSGADGNVLIAIMGSPVRDKDTGALIGQAGASLYMSAVQTMVEEIKPFVDGYAMLFSPGGLVAAHSDPQRLGKNMNESETDTFGPFLDTMVDAVTKGTPASFSYHPPQSDTIMQYYAVPFTIGHSPQPWTLVIGVPRNTIMAPVYRMLTISLTIGVLIILLMFAGVITTARSISRPLAYTMTVLKDIAEGDLTKQLTVNSKDEVGDFARYLNFTVDKIKNLVLSIKGEADALS